MTRQEVFEQRLKDFSLKVLRLIKILPKTEENIIYGRQVIRSSSSIGANYAEACCAHTPADFLHDMNKCRKESKESVYWLELIHEANPNFQTQISEVFNESKEIFKIFMSSVKTAKTNMASSK